MPHTIDIDFNKILHRDMDNLPILDIKTLDGEQAITILNDLSVRVNEKLTAQQHAAATWDAIRSLFPKKDKKHIDCLAALAMCVAAMKGCEKVSSKESEEENNKLWSEALERAERCFY